MDKLGVGVSDRKMCISRHLKKRVAFILTQEIMAHHSLNTEAGVVLIVRPPLKLTYMGSVHNVGVAYSDVHTREIAVVMTHDKASICNYLISDYMVQAPRCV